ncbi:citrate/2-methylcitrate synthase [Devosia psychrophila]|uniref:citrate synthase (unknown stereospecificity) n=1 Tax=Devosia psychrophila TaxID=728005 RepID=A0A0F5Q030_9HYPH|nr:citrate synthase [Devosia psychrophila]KKC34210.1 citrate synthase [Devosia psychrophila]SFD27463.1 citrate synthase [Devosia psychrophila]
MDWLTASEALALLGTQPQTLYANVSRGRIKARPDPADSRRSLYRGDDVRRLAQRASGRRKQEAVASEAMHWGEPVLPTAISTVRDGRLLFRGQDACELAETATLEQVAELLWQSPMTLPDAATTGQGLTAAFIALANCAADAPAAPRSAAALVRDANEIVAVLAQALAGQSVSDPLHVRLASHWDRPEAANSIRRALVLLADHELNTSTFAARVTVSTGASLWSGTLAGLATLRGPRHGLASPEVAALAQDVGHELHAEAALRDWLGEGRSLPGMGHQLYPDGDARCRALLRGFDLPPEFAAYLGAARSLSGEEPNIDFALAAMTTRFDLPDEAGITLFALGRAVGWLAHMIEQVISGEQIRPRARYVGV